MKGLVATLVAGAGIVGATMAEAGPLTAIGARVNPAAIHDALGGSGLRNWMATPFLGGSDDGTGIRRAAPGVVLLYLVQQNFAGGTTEGTGIRRAAPGVVIDQFPGGSQEGTGIRRAAPGVIILNFAGGAPEGTGI